MTEISIPPPDMLPVQARPTWQFRAVRFVVAPLLRAAFTLDVDGLETLPPGNYIAAANHLQWIDPIFLLAILPASPRLHIVGDPSPVMKRSRILWKLACRAGGIIPLDRQRRNHTALFHHVHSCLNAGGSVLIFPEGGCGTKEGKLQPFKKGFAYFATAAKVPVVPIGISGSQTLWFRKRISISVGKPILTDQCSVDSLVELTRQRIRVLLRPHRDIPGRRWLQQSLTTLF